MCRSRREAASSQSGGLLLKWRTALSCSCWIFAVTERLKAGASKAFESLVISLEMAGVMIRMGMVLRKTRDC